MWLLDITHLINAGRCNEYIFNPSILSIGNGLFLLTYRIILFDLACTTHPWSAWSYKVFKNPSQTASAKYRSWLGPAIQHVIPIKEQQRQRVAQFVPDGENDTTGLALLEFKNGSFQVVWNIGQLFPQEYNQDARLVATSSPSCITVIYNVFSHEGVSLRCRDLKLGSKLLELSSERFLFSHIYRNVEKHCSYEGTKNIIQYSLGDHFCRIVSGQITKTKCRLFDSLFAKYGKENVLISLATPSISYRGQKRLACGHAKIFYRRIVPCFDFLTHMDTKEIKPHGKYIYFAFFYEFQNETITRISPLFIPTINQSHLPYLLFMPIGLTRFPGANTTNTSNNIILSAGEGDVRCKLLVLREDEVEKLLESSHPPCFLTEQMFINHIGYFDHKWNCGDDAFQIVLRHLYKNTPHIPQFSSQFSKKVSINALGPGDVVNDYFVPSIVPENSVAIGVGIPYMDFLPFIQKFRRVYLRNSRDVANIPGTFFVPDLTFLLTLIWGTSPAALRRHNSIGIILARTYYHPDHVELYQDFIKELQIFVKLVQEAKFHVCFIPFCIHPRKDRENDLRMIEDVIQDLDCKSNIEVFRPTCESTLEYVKEIYFKVGQQSFNICTRFHSHIFSIIHHVPFISMTCGRKCLELMKDILPDCLYRLKANKMDLPIQFDGELFFHFFQQKYADKTAVEARLQEISNRFLHLLEDWVVDFFPMLRKYAKNVCTILWLPPKRSDQHGHSPEWRMDHALHKLANEPQSSSTLPGASSDHLTSEKNRKVGNVTYPSSLLPMISIPSTYGHGNSYLAPASISYPFQQAPLMETTQSAAHPIEMQSFSPTPAVYAFPQRNVSPSHPVHWVPQPMIAYMPLTMPNTQTQTDSLQKPYVQQPHTTAMISPAVPPTLSFLSTPFLHPPQSALPPSLPPTPTPTTTYQKSFPPPVYHPSVQLQPAFCATPHFSSSPEQQYYVYPSQPKLSVSCTFSVTVPPSSSGPLMSPTLPCILPMPSHESYSSPSIQQFPTSSPAF